MKYAPPMSVKKNPAGLFQGSVRHLGVALVVSVSVMACADMSSKPAEDKLIDAGAPLESSASSLAQKGIEPDEVAEAEPIKYRGIDQVIAIADA